MAVEVGNGLRGCGLLAHANHLVQERAVLGVVWLLHG